LRFGAAFGQNYDTALKNLKFRSIGPSQMGGCIDDLAIVESDPRVMYVGAAAGGIFKSVNGGVTWKASGAAGGNASISQRMAKRSFPI
jgi:hypothetical protein